MVNFMSKWRPHTTGILIGGLLLILVALVASYIVQNFHQTTQVKLASGVFNVQLADTDIEREQGLSGVESIDANGGVLIVFDTESNWQIWMSNMKFPIDIVWLDSAKKVVYIVTNASPDLSTSTKFTPTKPARYVLEVPAGTVKTAGVKIDDLADFTLKESQ